MFDPHFEDEELVEDLMAQMYLRLPEEQQTIFGLEAQRHKATEFLKDPDVQLVAKTCYEKGRRAAYRRGK